MTTILIRTLIIYTALILTMRLMGKRQIGELEVTDLVTTLLISEIAALPITNHDIPVSFSLLPMLLLLILEVLSSQVLIHLPRMKGLVSARPTILLRRGIPDQRGLEEARLSVEELMCEIRQQGLTDLSQVECAILEKNGKVTVLPRPAYASPTVGQMGLAEEPVNLMHVVCSNGAVNRTGLSLVGRDESWLREECQRRGVALSSIFCATANANGKLILIEKEKKRT